MKLAYVILAILYIICAGLVYAHEGQLAGVYAAIAITYLVIAYE
jgi:hypothetical protein